MVVVVVVVMVVVMVVGGCYNDQMIVRRLKSVRRCHRGEPCDYFA